MTSLLFVILLLIFGDCWAMEESEPNYSATDIKSVQIEALKHTVDQLIIRDKMRDRQLSEMKDSIQSLKGENLELKSRVKNLEIMNSKLVRETCSELLTDTEKDNSRRNQKLKMNKTQYDNHGINETGNLSNVPIGKPNRRLIDTEVIKRESSMEVAFSASYGDSDRTLSVGQTIVFQSPLVNLGNSFNKYTGVFSVKAAGVYVFFANILCQPNEDVTAEIVKDGGRIAYFSCYSTSSYENGSTMVIIDLPAGTSVWIRVAVVNNNDVHALASETSFSGFLLSPN